MEWANRAKAEILTAPRTWFGALTLRPEEQYQAAARAAARCKVSGCDFDSLSEKEQFLERCRAIGEDITKFLKRLRKNTGSRFRYIVVSEAHKSGLPHFHILLHELNGFEVVRYADLQREWKLGFSSWKLVDDKNAAWYLCKYLAKDASTRVRASLHYGQSHVWGSDMMERHHVQQRLSIAEGVNLDPDKKEV